MCSYKKHHISKDAHPHITFKVCSATSLLIIWQEISTQHQSQGASSTIANHFKIV